MCKSILMCSVVLFLHGKQNHIHILRHLFYTLGFAVCIYTIYIYIYIYIYIKLIRINFILAVSVLDQNLILIVSVSNITYNS